MVRSERSRFGASARKYAARGPIRRAPRHFNIGKDDAHLRVHFKHPQRFVGIACLQNIKAGLLEKIDAHQADEGLILDDEDGAARLGFLFRSIAQQI